MKIRSGFVSNSSSTSFIVSLNNSIPCPHCGRSDRSIIDMIDTASNGSSETELRWTDPRDYLIELEEEIVALDADRRKYEKMNPDDKAGFKNLYTVRYLKESAQNSLQRLLKIKGRIDAAREAGKQVIKFDLDYHDELLNALVKEQAERGTIEILEENG